MGDPQGANVQSSALRDPGSIPGAGLLRILARIPGPDPCDDISGSLRILRGSGRNEKAQWVRMITCPALQMHYRLFLGEQLVSGRRCELAGADGRLNGFYKLKERRSLSAELV